jgi:hypothetical protein
MSWQEDLQQLDTALAGGQISADDYRRRRDEVLAKASGGQSAQVPPAGPVGQPEQQPGTPPPGVPQLGPPTPHPGLPQPMPYQQPPQQIPPQQMAPQPMAAQQMAAQQMPQQPVPPQGGQGYFPPPFRWQATPPQNQQIQPTQQIQPPQHAQPTQQVQRTRQQPPVPGQDTNATEQTQTMRPVGQPDADRTQVVPSSPMAQDRTQVVPSSPVAQDRTQVVQSRPDERTQVVGPNSDGFGVQYYTPMPDTQGWQGQDSTPWGGAEFPPLAPLGNWGAKHGPEVFDTGGDNTRRIIAIVAAVVVLALIGGGIWWFTTGSAAPTTTHTPTPPTSAAAPRLPLNGLPGLLDAKATGPTTVRKSQQLNMFSPNEATILTGCGATNGLMESVVETTWFAQVHMFSCRSVGAAQSAAQALLAKQTSFGYHQVQGPGGLPEMYADNLTAVAGQPVDERLIYSNGTSVVRIEIRGHDQPSADQGMTTSLNTVTRNYPNK